MKGTYQNEKQIIYFDYTAGRGNYDDYEDDYLFINDTNQEKTTKNMNENHCNFKDSDIKTQKLNPQKLNQIKHQRRHSCNSGRASGRCLQAHDNENNFHLSNENIQNETTKYKISNSQSHQFNENMNVHDWSPIHK